MALERHVLFQRDNLPKGWKMGESANREEKLIFFLAMPMKNVKKLNSVFEAVSDPNGPQYGAYLSSKEVRELTATPVSTVQKVLKFLKNCTCENLGDSLRCQASVQTIEHLFKTQMKVFTHAASKTRAVRHFGSFSIPRALKPHVEFVSGLGYLIAPKAKAASQRVGAGDYYVTPETLRNLYNIGVSGSKATSQGVAEFSGNFN